MTTILPDTQPIRWYVDAGSEQYIGMTHVGDLTGVGVGCTAISDESDNAFLGALDSAGVEFEPLPSSGWLEAGEIYDYDGHAVMVRQDHWRTEHDPTGEGMLALFLTYRADAGDVLEWVVGEPVEIGTQRTYDGDTYTCIQGHVTQADYTPDTTPALWELVVEEPTEPQPWVQPTGAHDAYHLGDRVTYEGQVWECTATDASGNNVWEPGVYGWSVVE